MSSNHHGNKSWDTKSVWIFDLDGTMVDSMSHFADIASRVLQEYYHVSPEIAREQYRQTSGLPFVAQVEQLFPNHPRNAAAVHAYETAKELHYFMQPLFPDARAMLAALQQRNCIVAISSNNRQELIEGYLAQHQLHPDIVCGWTPHFAKGPDHFAHIAANTKHPSSAMVFVGDSLKDAATAASEGIDFVARVGTFTAEEFHAAHPHVAVVQQLTELL